MHVRHRVPGSRLVVAVMVALAAGLLAGCSTSSPETTSGPPTTSTTSSPSHGPRPFQPTGRDFRAIRAMLARRAHAAVHHDRRGFLATVDPTQRALVRRQTTLYDNLDALRIADLRYDVDTSSLVPAPIPGGDPVLRPSVVEHLQVDGTFRRAVSNPLHVTFVRRGGHWLLGAEGQPEGTGHFDSPQERPWFGVPIAVQRDGPMTVLVDREKASSLNSLTAAVHDDIRFDSTVLGVAPSYRILVDATSNGASYDFSSVTKEEAAAVTFPVFATNALGTSGRGLATMAIKVNPHNVDQIVADTGVIRHELTHFLLRRFTGSSPKWLTEGVATWIQYYPDNLSELQVPGSLYARLMGADRALPLLGLFNEDPQVTYPISQAAVTWLVSTYGVPKLLDLMRAYRTHYAGVNADALTPTLVEQVYGVSQAAVVRATWSELSRFQH